MNRSGNEQTEASQGRVAFISAWTCDSMLPRSRLVGNPIAGLPSRRADGVRGRYSLRWILVVETLSDPPKFDYMSPFSLIEQKL